MNITKNEHVSSTGVYFARIFAIIQNLCLIYRNGGHEQEKLLSIEITDVESSIRYLVGRYWRVTEAEALLKMVASGAGFRDGTLFRTKNR